MTRRLARPFLVLAALAALAPLPSAAQAPPQSPAAPPGVEVTLPLQGYYRPGKYMPVRVVTSLPPQPAGVLRIQADGAVTTVMRPTPRADDVLPFLPLRTLRDARWSIEGVAGGAFAETLKPLADSDVLVGYATGGAISAADAARVGSALFPGKTVIPIGLDAAEGVRTPVMAWGALDAIVMETPPEDFKISRHVAAGTAVVVRSTVRGGDQPTMHLWPWRRAGEWWALTIDLVGPRGVVAPEAYAPAHAWRPGQPAPLRRNVLLLGVAFAIVALGLTLAPALLPPAVRPRLKWLAVPLWVPLVAAAAAVAAGRWSARNPAGAQALGAVFVTGGETVQADGWFYARPLSPQVAWGPWEPEITVPVFESAAHAESAELSLHCERNGGPAYFEWPGRRGSVQAFLARAVYPPKWIAMAEAEPSPDPSPLRDLARRAYLRPGTRLGGDIYDPRPDVSVPRRAEWWPGVVVERGEGMTNDETGMTNQ